MFINDSCMIYVFAFNRVDNVYNYYICDHIWLNQFCCPMIQTNP